MSTSITSMSNSPAFLAKASVANHKLGDKPGDELVQPKDKTLTGHDFMKLLLCQLQCQNPLEPMSSSDMMGQISSLTSTRLSESLDLFSKNQNSALGQGMLGREVVIQTTDAAGKRQEVKGIISAIEDLGKSSCKIEVNGKFYKPTEVVRISSHTEPQRRHVDANLLGKIVEINDSGESIRGEVTALANPNLEARVCVNGKWYDPEYIQKVSLKEEA